MDHAACWCGQLRGCAVRRVSPESDGATRAVRVGRARQQISTTTCVRYTLYRIGEYRTAQHGLQYSKLTTTSATPCNAVIHTTARVSADQYQVRSLSVLRAGVDGPAVRGAVTLTDSISLARGRYSIVLLGTRTPPRGDPTPTRDRG